MSPSIRLRHAAIVTVTLTLPLALAACGGTTASNSSMTSEMATTAAEAPMSSSPDAMSMSPSSGPMGSPMAGMAADQVFGPACASVPTEGAGSFDGMATDPVATAASNNPALSTLVSAVMAAGLVDSLNSAQGITVFAPVNDAFAALDKKTLDKAMADPTGLLTTVLTYHVVPEQLGPDQLVGMHKTLQGGTLDVTGSGEDFTVNGSAHVVCGNVPTANATVYLIDGVLLPS